MSGQTETLIENSSTKLGGGSAISIFEEITFLPFKTSTSVLLAIIQYPSDNIIFEYVVDEDDY